MIPLDLHDAVTHAQLQKAKDLIAAGADVNLMDGAGNVPLACARSAEMAQLLLDNGADMHKRDHYGSTVMMLSLRQPEVVRTLLERGADPNEQSDNGDTALIWCARWGHAESARLLLKNGASMKLKNRCGKDALAEAQENNQQSIVDLLREEQDRPRREAMWAAAMAEVKHARTAARQRKLKSAAIKPNF